MTKMTVHHTPSAAAESIKQGCVIACPTESVWGLSCDPFNEDAFRKLLQLKHRCEHKGVIVVAGTVAQVMPYIAHLPIARQQQMIQSWTVQPSNPPENKPQHAQATTWIIPHVATVAMPHWIMGIHDGFALRVSPHPMIQAICAELASCLVSTSCNVAGESPACTLDAAQAIFADRIDYLAGDTLGYAKPSRIIDAATGNILR